MLKKKDNILNLIKNSPSFKMTDNERINNKYNTTGRKLRLPEAEMEGEREPLQSYSGSHLQDLIDNKIISKNNILLLHNVKIYDILVMIKKYQGLIYLVAEHFNCSHNDLLEYQKVYPEIREGFEHEHGLILDTAEQKLYEYISNGDFEAVRFFLATKGASRGYIIPKNGTAGKVKSSDATAIARKLYLMMHPNEIDQDDQSNNQTIDITANKHD